MGAPYDEAQGAATPRASDETTDHSKSLRKNTKKYHVLEALASGRRFHRFDAERDLHDHCLPSTITAIERDLHIEVSREIVPVPGHNNSTAYVAEYFLKPEQAVKAKRVLA